MARKKTKVKAKRKTAKKRVTKKRAPVRRKKAATRKKTATRKKKTTARSVGSSRHLVAALDKAGKVLFFNGASYGTRSNAVEFGSSAIAERMAGQLVRQAGAHMQAVGVFPSTAKADSIREEFLKKR